MNNKYVAGALIAFTAALMSAAPASATAIVNATSGLAAPARTITFSEKGVTANTALTNQYASLGVTFQNATQYPQAYQATNFSGDNIGNFGGSDPALPTTLTFGFVQTAAAFALISNDSLFTFNAFLGNTAVESFTATAGVGANNYFGFRNISFDRIQIVPTDAFLLDNLQLSNVTSAVPESATWAMMILGMGAVGYSLRRAKRRSDVKFDSKIKRITAGALA